MTQIIKTDKIEILQGDNLEILKSLPSEKFSLIYIDPPYGVGKIFTSHNGSFDDKVQGEEFIDWIKPRIEEAYRVLKPDGSFFIHMDYREIHYVKVLCDKIFGRDNFINEIIWSYDYGGRSKRKWSAKHDNILWYAKNHKNYTFNFGDMDRIPYMAPGLVGPEKAAIGKTPTSCWWMTIVPTQSKERLGYPTQKPMKLLERIVKIHSNENEEILDFFAGSGTTGDAALKNKRKITLIDQNPQSIEIIKKRLVPYMKE
jgi:site-specific DNA-methyltransferase (adenine-specific)